MTNNKSMNILVANDSLFFRTKLSNVLIWASHNIKYAEDRNEVIEALRVNPDWIDLMILDVQLPDIDGYGVLQWMGEHDYVSKFPILAVTGAYEASGVIESLKDLGVSGFISKSLAAEQVILQVNKLLFSEKVAKGFYRERVSVSIPADFSIGSFGSTGTIINISESGAFLYTGAKLDSEIELDLKFSLPGIDKVLNIKSTLKWAIDSMADQSVLCGYGLMFSDVSKDDQETLEKFITKYSQSQM